MMIWWGKMKVFGGNVLLITSASTHSLIHSFVLQSKYKDLIHLHSSHLAPITAFGLVLCCLKRWMSLLRRQHIIIQPFVTDPLIGNKNRQNWGATVRNMGEEQRKTLGFNLFTPIPSKLNIFDGLCFRWCDDLTKKWCFFRMLGSAVEAKKRKTVKTGQCEPPCFVVISMWRCHSYGQRICAFYFIHCLRWHCCWSEKRPSRKSRHK